MIDEALSVPGLQRILGAWKDPWRAADRFQSSMACHSWTRGSSEPLLRGSPAPYREANFGPHTGPFLFEFQRHGMLAKDFVGKLDAFFAQLPRDFSYAVEIRSAGVLGSFYRDMLASHGVAHVYNHRSYMPALAE